MCIYIYIERERYTHRLITRIVVCLYCLPTVQAQEERRDRVPGLHQLVYRKIDNNDNNNNDIMNNITVIHNMINIQAQEERRDRVQGLNKLVYQ